MEIKPSPTEDVLSEGEEGQEVPFGIEYAQTDRSVKPVYLFADSQMLFWKPEGTPFLRSVTARLTKNAPLAVYIGASNGDDPAYFSIFDAAMEEAGVSERRMVRADPGPDELDDLDRADLILLAGGDVERGWRTFEANGLKQILVRRYYEGALMMGISAGAVQLGLGGWPTANVDSGTMIDTLRILPHVVGAHEEAEDWKGLKAAVLRMGGHVRGYGMPFGGGFIYHPDHSIQPLRRPLVEIRMRGSDLRQGVLLPGEMGEADPSDPVIN